MEKNMNENVKVIVIIIKILIQKQNKNLCLTKLSEIPVSKKLQQLNLDHSSFPSDIDSLFFSSRSLTVSIYTKIGTGLVLTKDRNVDLANIFKGKFFRDKNTEDSFAKSVRLEKRYCTKKYFTGGSTC